MAPQISSAGSLIHNDLSEESGQSSFACSHCRRQKVKCDRSLPSCANCNKSSRPCTYPLTVQKPGPKAGTHRRPRVQISPIAAGSPTSWAQNAKKRRKLDGSPPSVPPSLPTPPTGPLPYQQSHDYGQIQSLVRRSSNAVSPPSHSPKATARADDLLSRIVHPDHDPADSDTIRNDRPENDKALFLTRFGEACARLGCSIEQGWDLIEAYFRTMTSHSLFHRPTFEQKLSSIASRKELQAFLSALFSYALRFKDSVPSVKESSLSATIMLDASCRLQYECVEECFDEDPPLHLLQSFYLVTFQKLIHGVRGKTWRMLGDCIRMGYELRLHLIDANPINSEPHAGKAVRDESWIVSEERRRIWWALWEMDIFTSTIRRLPNAIDERLNYTFLPVPDENWFTGVPAPTCFLAADATQRWKDIADSGNRSPQTWFILVNSYMFDAHKMGSFPEVWASRIGFDIAVQGLDGVEERFVPKMRDFLDNCLRCAHMSLPPELNWEARYLAFDGPMYSEGSSTQALDSARYCIHVMCQMARLMLCTPEVYRTTSTIANSSTEQKRRPAAEDTDTLTTQHHENGMDNGRRFWDRYLDAANLIAEVIRNSSPQHYQFVNPLIANSIWYAAASLVVAKLFGPPGFDSRLGQSNFDLLVTTLNKYELFWQIPSVLKYKLRNLEVSLNHLKQKSAPTPQRQGSIPILGSGVSSNETSATTGSTSQYDQQNSHNTAEDLYTGLGGEDWLQQDLFDFSNIPTFGFGQADLLQPMPVDASFENNVLLQNEGINFNDLFMYPYQ
ncbi:hypothetical protein PMZ80_004689 [Knufia obscura]|uniref:Zn(2)-C6 fungal-type domain-containing protein n=2 Tax=Knufia TaxID=430999 RepID=A0AAN8ENS3_9EURO|nr:hypothetical protein PMZ80_004689 [Knufia obscura]KAK5952680.1 hypothetical protein OHC33_006272 [Knufia fluminis]